MRQGRPKMTLRKTFEGDFKKMELSWGMAEREAKERISWRKKSGCIILNVYKQTKKKMKILNNRSIIAYCIGCQALGNNYINKYIHKSTKIHVM